MKRIAILDTRIEYERFTSKIFTCEIFITHQNPFSFFKLYLLNLNQFEIIFVASRVPDIFLLKFLKNKASNIIVLQHAFTENNKFYNFSYLKNNLKKFSLWFCSIIFMLPLLLKKKTTTNLSCFYFTDYYKRRIKKIYDSSKFNKCSEPNPLIYGSPFDIEANKDICEFFYIDEPLTKTLGISVNEEINLIKNLIRKYDIKKLYVKIHPRSNKDKYLSFKNIFPVDCVFINSTNIVGYKSNLLRYNYNSKFLIYLDNTLMKWKKKKFTKKYKTGYISDVIKFNGN